MRLIAHIAVRLELVLRLENVLRSEIGQMVDFAGNVVTSLKVPTFTRPAGPFIMLSLLEISNKKHLVYSCFYAARVAVTVAVIMHEYVNHLHEHVKNKMNGFI